MLIRTTIIKIINANNHTNRNTLWFNKTGDDIKRVMGLGQYLFLSVADENSPRHTD